MDKSLFSGIYYELLRAWPSRWFGFSIALVVSAIVATVVIALPDKYQSRSRLYVNSEVVLKPLLKGLTIEDDSDGKKLVRVLQTTLLNQQNIDALVTTPGMGFDAATASGRARAARTIRSGVTIGQESDNEDLFVVTYNDTDPVRARNVVHGLISFLIQTNLGATQLDLKGARAFLDRQIAEYEVKVRELEDQVAAYRLRNVEVLGATNYQTQLSTALTVLRDAQLARRLAVEERDRIQENVAKASGSGGTASTVLLATDQAFPAAMARLTALQTQLNQLLLQYTDRHPDVIATRREISTLTRQYGLAEGLAAATKPFSALPGQVPPAQAVGSAVATAGQATSSTLAAGASDVQAVSLPTSGSPNSNVQLNSDLPSARQMQLVQANFAVLDADRKMAAAQAAVNAIQQHSTSAPAAEIGLEELMRNYTLVKENYEQLIRRRESARMTEAANDNSGTERFRIVEASAVSNEPAGPDRKSYLMIGTLLSLLTGGGLAYALGLLRGTFVTAAEAEEALGLPVIARLSNVHGLFSRASQSVDAFFLIAGIVGLFVGSYVLSVTTSLLIPLRAEIYRLMDIDFIQLIGRLF